MTTQARTSRTWSIMWYNVGMLPLPVCWSAPAMPLPISNGLVGYRMVILYVIIHAEQCHVLRYGPQIVVRLGRPLDHEESNVSFAYMHISKVTKDYVQNHGNAPITKRYRSRSRRVHARTFTTPYGSSTACREKLPSAQDFTKGRCATGSVL